jgi:hypothetical protein
MRSTQTSRTQLHAVYFRTTRKEKAHSDYSPNLHLSTRVSSVLKRPVAFHSSASLRMLRITTCGEGVAPSRTMSFRCLQRHQQIRQPQSSSLKHLRPFHARIAANWRARPLVVEADLLYPTNVGKQLTRSALERNQAVSVRWIPGQKGACRGARESTPLQRVRHPTSVTQRQPKEESAFVRGTGFPNL